MTPKEKAEDLLLNIKTVSSVDENCILKNISLLLIDEVFNAINPFGQLLGKNYWEEVKQEILKL